MKDRAERISDGLLDTYTTAIDCLQDTKMKIEDVGATPNSVKDEAHNSPRRSTEEMHTKIVPEDDSVLRLGIRESFRMKVVQWMLDVRILRSPYMRIHLLTCPTFAHIKGHAAEFQSETTTVLKSPPAATGIARYPLARSAHLYALFPAHGHVPFRLPCGGRMPCDDRRRGLWIFTRSAWQGGADLGSGCGMYGFGGQGR